MAAIAEADSERPTPRLDATLSGSGSFPGQGEESHQPVPAIIADPYHGLSDEERKREMKRKRDREYRARKKAESEVAAK